SVGVSLAQGSAYYVLVDSIGAPSGVAGEPTAYTLTMVGPPEPPPPPPPPPADDLADAGDWDNAAAVGISVGTGNGAFSATLGVGDSDLARFTPTRSGLASVNVSPSGQGGNQLLRVRVYDSTRTLVETGQPSGQSSTLNVTVVQGQTYFLLVDGTGTTGGSAAATAYSVLVQGPPEPPPADDHADQGQWSGATPAALDAGTGSGTLTGVLGTTGDTDLFRFVAVRSGDTPVSAMRSSGNQSIGVSVWSAGGQALATGQASGVGASLTVSLEAGQTYYLLVYSRSGSGGTPSGYQVSIVGPDLPPPPPPPPPPADDFADAGQWDDAALIALGQTSGDGARAGELEAADDTDLFRFTAVRSGVATIVGSLSSGDLGVLVRVFDAQGQQIALGAASGGSSIASATLSAGQTYFVLVSGAAGGGNAAAYQVEITSPVQPPPPPPPPPPVSDLPDSVLPAGEQRLATGLAGGKTVVSFVSAAGGAMFAERGADGVWRAVDVRVRTNGPAMSGELRTFVDPRDGLTYVVGTSDMGVMVYKRAASGAWSKRNLTRSIAGADSIARGLSVVTDPQGLTQIVGLNAA
ncbi:MAG: hypothetical protein K2Q20_12755, partial [Phycisphaerales bacterium]|nr:hypothetical protein [Phycisphaerales bacterium]